MKNLRPFWFLASLAMLALLSFNGPVQESLQLDNILGKLMLYNNNERPEKTYLQTDKDFYTNGETIWFKTYLVDGIDHRASNRSRVVHVELVGPDGQVVERRKQFVLGPGAEGEIRLDQELQQGEYTLRAYTKYMLNEDEPVLFEKKIPIRMQSMATSDIPETPQEFGRSIKNDDDDDDISELASRIIVRFFPEGGSSLTGCPQNSVSR
ncbi:MG2 domain-containing protein [Maribacter litopenaei]|uniref:MG2 domain-containing protein n=1 Tax=Maribacter litopenaei TaxID=2976127 RepID=A0ABY5YCR2_9FLAO|nr:MG2 domain-containing protein [Maribacter litopenaei]UWX55910.1 MG2 domain-containing protein [Maribacter litopenaei]